jgi:hypothetical protein
MKHYEKRHYDKNTDKNDDKTIEGHGLKAKRNI